MLDFSQTDFSTAEDISMTELAPQGTVVMLYIKEVGDARPNANNKKFFPVTFEVMDGPYIGKELKDNFYLDGKDFALQKTSIFVRYVLETTKSAHLGGKEAYKIANHKALVTGKVVARLDIEGFYNDKGDWILVNKIKDFATPRPDSSSFKVYEAYVNKTQPWQVPDYKPTPPNTPRHSNAGNASYEHATQEYLGM